MSKKLILKKLGQMVEGSKGASSLAKSTSTAKGVVIREKCPRGEVPDTSPSETGSKGKEAMPPFEAKKKAKSAMTPSAEVNEKVTLPIALGEGTSANPGIVQGPKASILESPSVVEKILGEVILPADKEKVDKLTLDQAVMKFFHVIGQVLIWF